MTEEQRAFGAGVFAALGSPARLRIVEYLAAGPAPVTRIAEETGMKQPVASAHLAALLKAGAVVCTPEGNRRIYSLRGPRVTRILELVEEFYQVHLADLRGIIAREAAQG